MNGIICINKPSGCTSFDVVARVRGMTKTKQVGHSGTLDPMATGVLPVFVGRATKAIGLLPEEDKQYEAEFRLGLVTDTQDDTGKILREQESRVSRAELAEALAGFVGETDQLPPMFSAVKVNGKKLYELARQGLEIERSPRRITVYELALLAFDEAAQSGRLSLRCSKGTYIRTILHDAGQRLGAGAAMTALVRTMACGFPLSGCVTLEQAQELADAGALEQALLPVERLFDRYPPLVLTEAQALRFQNGVKLYLKQLSLPEGNLLRVYGQSGCFLGLASPDRAAGELRIEKLFCPALPDGKASCDGNQKTP